MAKGQDNTSDRSSNQRGKSVGKDQKIKGKRQQGSKSYRRNKMSRY